MQLRYPTQWVTDDVLGRARLRDIRYFGGKRGTDCTSAFATAFAESGNVYVPAGDWYANNIVVGVAGSRLRTDGYATKIIQDPAASSVTPLILVTASDVMLDSLTVQGNIATSTGEFQHGVMVRNPSGNIVNVTVGDIVGINLRGDVLYIGSGLTYSTRGVRFGRIVGRNVLRNVVSITGETAFVDGNAAMVDISGGNGCGYATLDIESDTGICTDIFVRHVRGGVLQCAPPDGANAARRIHIGSADLAPSYSPNSSPGYSLYAAQIVNAVSLRNTVDIKIDHLRLRNHTGLGLSYVYNSGEQKGESIHIGYLDVANVGSGESTYNAVMQVTNVNSIRIDDGDVSLQAVGDYLIHGDPTAAHNTRVSIGGLRIDGTVVRFCRSSSFERITINSANVATAFRDMDDSVVSNSDITLPRLGTNIVNCSFVNVNATCSTSYITGTSSNVRAPGSKLGGAVAAGSFVFPAAASVVVNTAHCRADSHVQLQAASSTAGTLVGSAKCPYVASVSEGSFTVQTANGTNALGTETFKYYIL